MNTRTYKSLNVHMYIIRTYIYIYIHLITCIHIHTSCIHMQRHTIIETRKHISKYNMLKTNAAE
jgi:hypothetical protein